MKHFVKTVYGELINVRYIERVAIHSHSYDVIDGEYGVIAFTADYEEGKNYYTLYRSTSKARCERYIERFYEDQDSG